jgi:PAS domain S-box-containing protein
LQVIVEPDMQTGNPLDERILEQAAEAIVDANRDGVIERWNAGAVAMFGFTAAETIGQKLELMIPEHLRAAHWRAHDKAIASGATRLGGLPTITRGVHKWGAKL